MKFVLYCTYVPADQILEVSQKAESLGFDAVSIPDHVVYPHAYQSPYPYATSTPGERAPWSEDCDWPDPMTTAAAITASTTRLRVITGIYVLPLRNPLFVAKAVSTVDIISGGRLILGVGVGWLREEFEILGAEYRARGRRSEEAIAVLRKLWSGERTQHEGEFFQFGEITMRPAPERNVPIYLGGDSDRTIDRAARIGDGMLPPLGSDAKTRDHMEAIARRRSELEISAPFEYIAPAARCRRPEDLETQIDCGAESVHVDPFATYVRRYGGLSIQERHQALERFAKEVIVPVQGIDSASAQKPDSV